MPWPTCNKQGGSPGSGQSGCSAPGFGPACTCSWPATVRRPWTIPTGWSVPGSLTTACPITTSPASPSPPTATFGWPRPAMLRVLTAATSRSSPPKACCPITPAIPPGSALCWRIPGAASGWRWCTAPSSDSPPARRKFSPTGCRITSCRKWSRTAKAPSGSRIMAARSAASGKVR